MAGVMVCGSRTITDVKWVETQIVNYLKEVYADQEKRFGQGDMDFSQGQVHNNTRKMVS